MKYVIKNKGEWIVNQHGQRITFTDKQKALEFILLNFELDDKTGFKIVKRKIK